MDMLTFKSEALEIIRISWPMTLVGLLQMMTFTVSASFCGRLSKELMDAVSLASTFINMFGLAAVSGLTSACYTIFSQIHGSQNKASMGLNLQRGLLVLVLGCVPITALFINVEHLMVLAGQNEGISREAGKYILLATAGIPAYALSSVLRSYTYTQGIIHVHYLIQLVTNLVNVGFHLLFLDVLELEIRGAGLAICLTAWLTFGLYLLYIIKTNSHEGLWNGWTINCVDNLGEILRLAIPGMLMNIFGWGVYDILTFVVGLIGKVELAAYSITYYLTFIAKTIPLGLSYGAGVRVGNLLGANKPDQAKCAFMITLLLAPLVGLFFPTILLCVLHQIPYLFTENKKVRDLTLTCLLWMAPQVFLIAVQVARQFDRHRKSIEEVPLTGVLRGMGQQAFGAYVNVIACVLVGVPVAMSVMFRTNLGVIGAYIGMILANFFQFVIFSLRLSRVNWHHAATIARERLRVKMPERLCDKGAIYMSVSQDEGHTKSRNINYVPLSKRYGALACSFTERNLLKQTENSGESTDEDDFIGDIAWKDTDRVAEDHVKRKKQFLWYKLATIVLACLIILGAALFLNQYLRRLFRLS